VAEPASRLGVGGWRFTEASVPSALPRALLSEVASIAEELARSVKRLEDLSVSREAVARLLAKIDDVLFWKCPRCGTKLPRSVEPCPCTLPPLW